MSNIAYFIYHAQRLCILQFSPWAATGEKPMLSGSAAPVTRQVTERELDTYFYPYTDWRYAQVVRIADMWRYRQWDFPYFKENGVCNALGGFTIPYPAPPNRSRNAGIYWYAGRWNRSGKPLYTQVILDEQGNLVFQRMVADRWVAYHTVPLQEVLK